MASGCKFGFGETERSQVEKSLYSASSVGHFCYVFSLNRSAVTVECIPGCTLPDSFTITL